MLVLFGIGEIIYLFGYWLLCCSHALDVQGNNLELLPFWIVNQHLFISWLRKM